MKKLTWVVMDGKGEVLDTCSRRSWARDSKKFYLDNIFEGWMRTALPITIVREEWELIDKKVVR